jgi:hypothetical protein
MARLVFLDGHTRELYGDWPAKARAVVGTLRVAAGRFPYDPSRLVLPAHFSGHTGVPRPVRGAAVTCLSPSAPTASGFSSFLMVKYAGRNGMRH